METKTQTTRQTFLNPEELLRGVPILPGSQVGDFGCGNGHYAAAAARLAGSKGQIYALDIQEEALSQTASLARLSGLYNVSTLHCNLEKWGSCPIKETSLDIVIVGSLLHQVDSKDSVIREAYRLLKSGGKIVLVEWDESAAFGPDKKHRLAKEESRKFLEKNGFRPEKELAAGSFHYGLVYIK